MKLSLGWLQELQKITKPKEEPQRTYTPEKDLNKILSFMEQNFVKEPVEEPPTASESAEEGVQPNASEN